MAREIEIVIDETTGEIEMETLGFKGKECENVLDKLQSALRAEKLKQTDKPEKQMQAINVAFGKNKQQIRNR